MTGNRSNEDAADENKEHRVDEALSSEDVDDESKEHGIDIKDEEEHGIYR